MTQEEREIKEQEIRNLQSELASTVSTVGDWKVAKCYEYRLAGLEDPYDINELHAARQVIRRKINDLQAELDEAEADGE